MLPVRRAALSHALTVVAQLEAREQAVRLRVGLQDGTVLDGDLISASTDHLSLRLPVAQARYVPADQICSVHLAHRRPFRELAVVAVGIVAATATLVASASVPLLRAHVTQGAEVVITLGIGILGVLMARTGLRNWLTSWQTLVDVREP